MSNGRNMHSMEFPLADLLMMMEAMRIKGNVAMMSPYKGAEDRLREYQARFDALIPPHARQFDSMALCEINIELQEASYFHIFTQRPHGQRWWHETSEGRLVVQINGKRWSTKSSNIKKDDEVYNGVLDLLKELAPMDCDPILEEPTAHPESS
ncbi:hypothetical protein [Erythrobacter aureus]|uniref:Uncharacterized protein n=1 Tax=Erythrobacter aureus TaxID=2182384 RepID=A0A345YJE8_9SPHN|nr:hypothetical protein [Erythrobacter aureus]AXK44050.1 hypothetical protein DVR09_16485 [Erythrobacter aureus]